jgi:hypothetical protein
MFKQLWRSTLIAALLILIGTTFPITQATLGDLDRSFAGFGAAGRVILPGLNMPGNYGGMALAPDGKIVMVGFKFLLSPTRGEEEVRGQNDSSSKI